MKLGPPYESSVGGLSLFWARAWGSIAIGTICGGTLMCGSQDVGKSKRLCLALRATKPWTWFWLLTAFGLICPVNVIFSRLALIIGVFGVWSGGLFLFWRRPTVRFPLLMLGTCWVAFLILPGYDLAPRLLREEYVSQLLRYEKTWFLWGGENVIGIDCSGLVRRGLIHADLKTGILTANPRPVRQALSLWWFDRSARALAEGYRGDTRVLFSEQSINALNHARLLPGDLAVTSDGIHVLAYIGGQRWIEADPDEMKAITVSAPAMAFRWFNVPVDIVRWRQLDDVGYTLTGLPGGSTVAGG